MRRCFLFLLAVGSFRFCDFNFVFVCFGFAALVTFGFILFSGLFLVCFAFGFCFFCVRLLLFSLLLSSYACILYMILTNVQRFRVAGEPEND